MPRPKYRTQRALQPELLEPRRLSVCKVSQSILILLTAIGAKHGETEVAQKKSRNDRTHAKKSRKNKKQTKTKTVNMSSVETEAKAQMP